MKKKILAFITSAMCLAGLVPANAVAKDSVKGLAGLQEEGGSGHISGENTIGGYVDYYYKISDISATAEADTAKLIIDKDYVSDSVNSSCTVKSLGSDLTIDAGDNDIIVLLDEAVLEKTITVKADKGSVTFFIQGSLTCGKESKGIVWHEICEDCKITGDKYIPICFYGSEDSVITLNDEAVLCGSLRLPYTVLDDRSSGAFKIEYVSEYDNKVKSIKPSIIGNVLLQDLINDEIVIAYCSGKDKTSDVYTEVVEDPAIKDIALFEEGETMTLDDVIELSKKGNALTLKDFVKYKGVIAGSGIFILEYDLGNGYTLTVGSVELYEIDYARLRNSGSENYIDIRTDDVEKFISASAEASDIKGDANCDGQVDMADVVLIMQALANPNKYGIGGTAEHHLTEQGKLSGDMDGDGLTVGDALAIQRKLLGLDSGSAEQLEKIRQQLSDFFTSEKIDYTVIPKDKMPEQFADKYVFIKVNTVDTSYATRYGAFLKASGIDSSLIKSIPYKIDSDTELNKIRELLYCYILENSINASVDPADEESDLKNKTVLVKYYGSSETRTQLENLLKGKNIDLDLVEFSAVE